LSVPLVAVVGWGDNWRDAKGAAARDAASSAGFAHRVAVRAVLRILPAEDWN
jgi:hypothetical protein